MSAARPRGRSGHLLPRDWPFAVRTGLESVLGGWLLAVVPTIAVYVSTSSLDAAAALSLGTAVRTGTALWSLSLGGSYGQASGDDGVLGLPLLGLTLLVVLLVRSAVRRSRPSGVASVLCAMVTTALMSALVLAVGAPAGSRTWPAALVLPVLVGLVGAVDVQRRGVGSTALAEWWSQRPPWVSPALGLARGTATVTLVLGAVLLAVAAVDGANRFTRLHDALSGAGFIAALGLLLIQAAWVPDALVWAVSWLAGPGFTVGSGTLFSPDAVVAGAVPTLPLLGLLPTGPLGGEGSSAGLYVPLVLTLVALVVAWRRRAELTGLDLGQSALAGAGATVVLALGTWLACLAASGPIGPGRLADVGPATAMTVLLVALEAGFGLVTGCVLVHPRARVLTERGVSATAGAAASAASGARSRVEAGLAAGRVAVQERRGGSPEETGTGQDGEESALDEPQDLPVEPEHSAATPLSTDSPEVS